MKKLILILTKLFTGFILASIAIVMIVNSNLGLSPWEVLSQGLSKITFLTLGQASIMVSITVIIISALLGVSIGIGTILNGIFVGIFVDIIAESNLIVECTNIYSGIIMLIIGLFLLAYGTLIYMSCGLGCGPRDGLMVSLAKKTNLSIGLIKGLIELSVMILGYLLGGFVGIGTIITVLFVGYIYKITFKFFNFEASKIHHKSIKESLLWIKTCF